MSHCTFFSGQKVQIKGCRFNTKRHRIRASRSDAHTPQSNEHRLKPLSSFLSPYETDFVCASSTCILFMLLLVDRGFIPPAPSFFADVSRLLLLSICSRKAIHSPPSAHYDKHVDRWSHDFSPSHLSYFHTLIVTYIQGTLLRSFHSHRARA